MSLDIKQARSKNLPKYNPKAKCRKCGGTGISSFYQGEGAGFKLDLMPWELRERIERLCRNCGYEWWEIPNA